MSVVRSQAIRRPSGDAEPVETRLWLRRAMVNPLDLQGPTPFSPSRLAPVLRMGWRGVLAAEREMAAIRAGRWIDFDAQIREQEAEVARWVS